MNLYKNLTKRFITCNKVHVKLKLPTFIHRMKYQANFGCKANCKAEQPPRNEIASQLGSQ